MGKGNGAALAQVVVDIGCVGRGLQFVGHGEHDQVAPFRRLGDVHDLQPLGLAFRGRGGTRTQRHDDVLGARIAQVQGMGMALAAIAKDGDASVLDQVHIAVAVVVNAHGVLHLVGGGTIRVLWR